MAEAKQSGSGSDGSGLKWNRRGRRRPKTSTIAGSGNAQCQGQCAESRSLRRSIAAAEGELGKNANKRLSWWWTGRTGQEIWLVVMARSQQLSLRHRGWALEDRECRARRVRWI